MNITKEGDEQSKGKLIMMQSTVEAIHKTNPNKGWLYLVVAAITSPKRLEKFKIIMILKENMSADKTQTALVRAKFLLSTRYATGTSSMDIEEVKEAITISAKKANAIIGPTLAIESNNAGNTVKIS